MTTADCGCATGLPVQWVAMHTVITQVSSQQAPPPHAITSALCSIALMHKTNMAAKGFAFTSTGYADRGASQSQHIGSGFGKALALGLIRASRPRLTSYIAFRPPGTGDRPFRQQTIHPDSAPHEK